MPEQVARVDPNSLRTRLDAARMHVIAPHDLAARWFDQTVYVRLAGATRLIADPELTNHFRRSLGGALGAGASPEANAGKPCPWEPPCALDVFFREQTRIGGDGLPKPFITLADADGPDLIAGLRVFGFAADWMPTLEHAFVDALRHRLPWKRLGARPPRLRDRWIETREGLKGDPPPEGVALDWATPLDAEAIDPGDKTGSILTRLHRRLCGLAHWHDCALADLPTDAIVQWEASADVSAMESPAPLQSHSGTQRRTFVTDASRGALRLRGDLSTIWPLLVMGERCAVGRGAVRGLGRYALMSETGPAGRMKLRSPPPA